MEICHFSQNARSLRAELLLFVVLVRSGEVFCSPHQIETYRMLDMSNSVLPPNTNAICVSKSGAAAMLNLSPGKFSELVQTGAMPKPRCAGTRRLWIVNELYSCAAALPFLDEDDNWADV